MGVVAGVGTFPPYFITEVVGLIVRVVEMWEVDRISGVDG